MISSLHMTILDADPWGSWGYDRTPANMTLDPDDLCAYLAEAQEYPDELGRQAHISLELALHPELHESDRSQFFPVTEEAYDRFIDTGEADLTSRLIHTCLPIILPSHSKTERAKATRTTRSRTIAFANELMAIFYETEDNGLKRQTIGHAAELLDMSGTRLLGYAAVPSQYRQDRAIPSVEGFRYSWDVTVPHRDATVLRPTLLQVKHRDFDDRKASYHKDITVHRVFRPEERMEKEAPKVFDLLRTALQINGLHDHGRFGKYMLTLAKTLTKAERVRKAA
jgi:hypothetical protein